VFGYQLRWSEESTVLVQVIDQICVGIICNEDRRGSIAGADETWQTCSSTKLEYGLAFKQSFPVDFEIVCYGAACVP
jgi:hypothetical protein